MPLPRPIPGDVESALTCSLRQQHTIQTGVLLEGRGGAVALQTDPKPAHADREPEDIRQLGEDDAEEDEPNGEHGLGTLHEARHRSGKPVAHQNHASSPSGVGYCRTNHRSYRGTEHG